MSRERSTNDERWEFVECRQTDPDMWFLDETEGQGTKLSEDTIGGLKAALSACNRCPLQLECLKLGLQGEDRYWGIWGGLLPAERIALLKKRPPIRLAERARTIRRLTGVAQP